MSGPGCDTTCRRVQQCWDWITPEDVVRFAIASIAMSRRACVPPAGEPFYADGSPWVGRHDFAAHLVSAFELQVKTRAYELGIRGNGGDDFEGAAVELAQWAKDYPEGGGKSAGGAA